MNIVTNITELLFPLLLLLFKSYIPYRIKLYKDKGNTQRKVDTKKEMGVEILRFPSDLLMIAAAYALIRLVPYIDTVVNSTGDSAREALSRLFLYGVLLVLIVFVALPLCVLGTRKCEALYFPDSTATAPHKVWSVILCVVLYIVVLVPVFLLMFCQF
jgi:uncharacterized membrane protein YidH (DUF202 family)